MKKMMVTVFVLALGLSGFADDPYADYIYLTADDTYTDNSWNNTDATEFKQGHWSEAFATDRNYYVPEGKVMYADAQSKNGGTWAGGELVVAGTLAVGVNRSYEYMPKIPKLVFLDDALLRSWSSYGLFASPTYIAVRASAAHPLVIQTEYKDKNYPVRLFADVHGAPGTGVRIQSTANAATNNFYYKTDTFSDFFGTLTVAGEKVSIMRTESNSHWFTMPGKLVVTDSAVFMPGYSEASTTRLNSLLGALEVTNGGVISFRENGDDAYVTLGITNSIRIADGGWVKVTNVTAGKLVNRAKSGAEADRRIAVRVANLSHDAVDNVDVGAAKVSMLNEFYDRAFGWKLLVVDKGVGTKDLYAGATNIATSVKDEASLTNAADWAGGVLPQEGNDFYFAKRLNPYKNWNFTESRLIFDDSSAHYWRTTGTKDLNAKEYHVLGSTSFTLWGNDNFNRRFRGGPLYLADGATFAFSHMDSCPGLRIESEVIGNGNLRFSMYQKKGEESMKRFRASLENLNTNWHGRLTIIAHTDATYPYTTILGDVRNWGSDFRADADCYSAVTLASNACVYVTNNVCFNDPTRGFLLKSAPGLMVQEGFMLTLSNQVTYAGVVTKSGEGVLELGGTACFEDGQATTAPVAGNNVLIITNGALKVTSRGACDGLAITFAEGSKLIVPAESTDGLFDVKWDAPLTVETKNGKIPVEIAVSGTLPEGGFTTTIATLNTTAAEQISVDTFKVSKVPGYVCAGVEKVTTDGGVAYQANFEKHGLIMLVK